MAFGGRCSCAQMLWSSIYYIPPGAHFELHKTIGMSKMVTFAVSILSTVSVKPCLQVQKCL